MENYDSIVANLPETRHPEWSEAKPKDLRTECLHSTLFVYRFFVALLLRMTPIDNGASENVGATFRRPRSRVYPYSPAASTHSSPCSS